jgi:hypothetical protein
VDAIIKAEAVAAISLAAARAARRPEQMEDHVRALPDDFVAGAGVFKDAGLSGYCYGMALLVAQRLLVVPSPDKRTVVCFKLDGAGAAAAAWLLHGGPEGDEGGRFKEPRSVIVAPGGRELVVVDMGKHQLQCFDLETRRHLWTVGEQGRGAGQLYGPTDATYTRDGGLAVADYCNHRISRRTAAGEPTGTLGSQGSGDGQLKEPMGIACCPRTGRLLVADFYNHRIAIWDENGVWVGTIGAGQGAGEGQLRYPTSVAVDGSSGLVLVGEKGRWCWSRVSVFREGEGGRYTFVRCLGGPGVFGAGAYPALAVDAATGAIAVYCDQKKTAWVHPTTTASSVAHMHK